MSAKKNGVDAGRDRNEVPSSLGRDEVDHSLLVDRIGMHATRDHRCNDQEEDNGDSARPLQNVATVHDPALLLPVPVLNTTRHVRLVTPILVAGLEFQIDFLTSEFRLTDPLH